MVFLAGLHRLRSELLDLLQHLGLRDHPVFLQDVQQGVKRRKSSQGRDALGRHGAQHTTEQSADVSGVLARRIAGAAEEGSPGPWSPFRGALLQRCATPGALGLRLVAILQGPHVLAPRGDGVVFEGAEAALALGYLVFRQTPRTEVVDVPGES